MIFNTIINSKAAGETFFIFNTKEWNQFIDTRLVEQV